MGPSYQYKATLARIVDGDTVHLQVDLGFRVLANLEFRLLGIDTPEVVGENKAAGIAAKQFLQDLIGGKTLVVLSVKSEKYGRWLGTIYAQQADGDWLNVNQAMIDHGYATPYPTK